MARSAQGQQEELDDDDEEHFTGITSSPHKGSLSLSLSLSPVIWGFGGFIND